MNDREKKAIALFNSGEFLQSHEMFEGIWVESSGEHKEYLQGIIQIGAAIIKIKLQPNLSAAKSLLRKGIDRLKGIDRAKCPVDIDRLINDAERLLQQTDKLDLGEAGMFSDALFPLLHYKARDN